MPHVARHRRLPLLAVVVAILAVVGIATTSQVLAHASATGQASSVVAPDDDGASVLGGETSTVVRVATDRVRPTAPALPVVGVLAVAPAAVASTGIVTVVTWRDRLRVADAPPVRRRGPPALVVA